MLPLPQTPGGYPLPSPWPPQGAGEAASPARRPEASAKRGSPDTLSPKVAQFPSPGRNRSEAITRLLKEAKVRYEKEIRKVQENRRERQKKQIES